MKYKQKNAVIKICALLYRYVFLLAICVVPFWITKLFYENTGYGFFLWFGIFSIVYAAYSLIGYLSKWKHIFCAFQNAYRQEMTPDHINWGKIKKGMRMEYLRYFLYWGLCWLLWLCCINKQTKKASARSAVRGRECIHAFRCNVPDHVRRINLFPRKKPIAKSSQVHKNRRENLAH